MEILKIHASKITKHGDIDYEAVVKLGDNFNGADLRNVCTEAGEARGAWWGTDIPFGQQQGIGWQLPPVPALLAGCCPSASLPRKLPFQLPPSSPGMFAIRDERDYVTQASCGSQVMVHV